MKAIARFLLSIGILKTPKSLDLIPSDFEFNAANRVANYTRNNDCPVARALKRKYGKYEPEVLSNSFLLPNGKRVRSYQIGSTHINGHARDLRDSGRKSITIKL